MSLFLVVLVEQERRESAVGADPDGGVFGQKTADVVGQGQGLRHCRNRRQQDASENGDKAQHPHDGSPTPFH